LIVEGSEQQLLFHIGRQRDWNRKVHRKWSKSSRTGLSLDDDDIKKVDQLMLEADPLLNMPALANRTETSVLLSDTLLTNTATMLPQNRNTAGESSEAS